MAAFNDQFERLQELEDFSRLPSSLWCMRFLIQVQRVLCDRGNEDIQLIAGGVEALLASVPSSSVSRQIRCDVSIFEDAGGAPKVIDSLQKHDFAISGEDVYAVIALWKFVDYLDVMRTGRSSKFFHWHTGSAVDSVNLGERCRQQDAPQLLAEACYASATAWTLYLASKAATDRERILRELREEESRRQKSHRDRSSSGGHAKNQKLYDPAKTFVQKEWQQHGSTAYSGNKSKFAEDYSRRVKHEFEVDVVPRTISVSWLKGL